jgi:hypothetical protein
VLRRSVESATLLGHWLFLPRLVSLHNLLLALGFVRRPRIADPRVSRKPFMRFIAMWTVGLPEKYRAAVPWSAQQPASSRPWDCSTRISCPMSQHLGEHLTDHFGVLDHVIFDNAGDLFRVAREIVPHDRSYQRHCSQRRPETLGNPQGDVTLVEFFDYSCGFCKRALSDMLALLKDDPKLKIVLKEFPILGPGSVEAARVAVAVRMQDPGGQKYLAFHQELLGAPGPATRDRALAAAKNQGLDMERLEQDMASGEVNTTLNEDMRLAKLIGATGTPTMLSARLWLWASSV